MAVRAILVFLLVTTASCTVYRGYGVLVWKNENLPFSMGTLVNVTSIFSVDNYYEVEYHGALVQVPMWQLEFFENVNEAQRYQESFKPYVNLYVFTLRPDGLPIRENTSSQAGMIGKLATARLAKVIGRDAEKTKIDRLEDYWYYILTEDGLRGYVYGYYLKTIESAANLDEKVQELIKADPSLERFLKNVWYPIKTADMLQSGRIDAEYLDKNYVLTPQPEKNRIILNNEDFTNREFVYSTIKKITGDTYAFSGTDLTVQIFPSKTINVGYMLNGTHAYRTFALIDKNMEEISRNETSRNQNMLSRFTDKGSRLESTSYGTIRLEAGGRFLWTSFESLQSIIPPGTAGRGTINFSRYLGSSLANSYDGVITFIFDDYPEYGVTFVYNFRQKGVRFLYVSSENIRDNQVVRIGSGSLVIFYQFME